jgi:CTP:molybdopterin cytidylyltransferase MocA
MLVTSIDERRGHPLLLGAEWISAFLALADDEPARKVTRSAGDRMHYATVTNHWVRDDLDTPSDLARAIHFLQD